MHLKTHFKFLFNSSKISTSCAHVIFFLNTRLHCEPTKIWITPFGSTHLELQNSQNNIKICINEVAFESNSHWQQGPACQLGPLVSDSETGEAHATARQRWSSPMASGGHYCATQANKRGRESLGGSWPRRAPTPARPHHGGRWWKRPMRPYQDPIGSAERWRR